MLSWMRWLTSWFWNIANSQGGSGGFLRWFGDNWASLAVFLIVAGVIIDWIVWMIRWRPYWIWTRKRQIIYEEMPKRRKKRRPAPAPAPAPVEETEDDPFSALEDPYAPKAAVPANDMAEWDSADDPYAHPAAAPAPHEPHFYGRPKLGKRAEPK